MINDIMSKKIIFPEKLEEDPAYILNNLIFNDNDKAEGME